MENNITREQWLRVAVEKLDEDLFQGRLRLEFHKDYQISCGEVKGRNALGDCINWSWQEGLSSEQFFPITIHISEYVEDPVDILGVVAHECIHGFLDIKDHKKEFAAEAKAIGFLKPYTKHNPSPEMILKLKEILAKIEKEVGKWPGKPLYTPPEKEGGKKRSGNKLFCPECGYELSITKKMLKKYEGKYPICPCGCHMGLQQDEEQKPEENEEK